MAGNDSLFATAICLARGLHVLHTCRWQGTTPDMSTLYLSALEALYQARVDPISFDLQPGMLKVYLLL